MNDEIKEENFNYVWKDSSREAILKQFYFEHIDLRKAYKRITELEEINKQHQELNGMLNQEINCLKEEIKQWKKKYGNR